MLEIVDSDFVYVSSNYGLTTLPIYGERKKLSKCDRLDELHVAIEITLRTCKSMAELLHDTDN